MLQAIISANYRAVLLLALTGLMSLAAVSGRPASETAAAISVPPSGMAQEISPASHCQYCISPTDKSFTSEGGSGSVAVTAPAGCNWTASTEDGFITLTSGSSGNGNGMVTYTVAPHSGSSRRVGHLTIAGQTHRVLQGVPFNDVPPEHLFYNEIGKLSGRGITLGCGAGNYCPEQAVTREQMAAFLIRALGDFTPPPPPAQRFQDVPPSNIFYAFIEQLALRQITLGCSTSPPLYCPTSPVTREQMAAFLIRALHEPGYVPPPPAQQRFQDVPTTNIFYAFIEELAARGITLGCSQNPPLYCPTQPVTRGQMAAFLIRAFDAGINRPPTVSAGPDRAVTLPSAASLSALVSDDGRPSCALTFLWSQVSGPGLVTFSDPDGEATLASFSAPGVYVLRLLASDFQDASRDDVTVMVNALNPGNQPPAANAGADQTLTLPDIATLSGTVSDDGVPSGIPPTASWEQVSGPGAVIFSAASAATTTASFSEAGSYVLRLTASDSVLTSSDEVTISVNADPTPPPPDPATVAPPVNPTVATTLGAATQFLYTGPNPIQTGVAAGTILPARAAVLRGQVRNTGGAPLSNVKISVLNHPEFGQTLTRADGMFDMAVNGDDLLTVKYEKPGLIPAQRQERVAWQEYSLLPDVVLMGYDNRVTHIDLSAITPIQVVRGSASRDGDGARRATLLFQQGTTATMVLPDGGSQALTHLHVRASEYTVGPNGPQAMPGGLPATSAYTYAVEYSVDEAVAVGARAVMFNQPVINYLENFLNFPVGGVVPVGSYDREGAAWIPSANGRVIRIVSIASGAAQLDTDGDGVVDNGMGLGVTLAERQSLAGLYTAGQGLWRVPIMHFGAGAQARNGGNRPLGGDADAPGAGGVPWDHNWPFGPPDDASGPPPFAPPQPPPVNSCEQQSSIIECQSQTLGERVPVVGTPFSLNYRSDRTVGRRDAYTLDIPLSAATVPTSLRRIELEVSVAGRRFTQRYAATPNQRVTFTWDGQDAYGRTLQGAQPVTVRLGYTYGGVYRQPSSFTSSFGNFGSSPLIGNLARREITIWQQSAAVVGGWDARAQGLGGWALSVHHAYDPVAQTLYLGDGNRRTAAALPPTITSVAGGGPESCPDTQPCGDGGPATAATIDAQGIAVDGQGNLFIADWSRSRVRKVNTSGVITTVAGTGVGGFGGDGGQAAQAQLNFPSGVAVDAQGNLFIADTSNHRVRKVDTAGVITTVAGTGMRDFGGDGGPATQSRLNQPRAVAVAPDGTLFIADFGNHRIRRISPDGIITTTVHDTTIDGSIEPSDVTLDGEGNLFFASARNNRVRRLSPDGRIITVAGGGGSTADGIPATSSSVRPNGIAVDRHGNLFITDAFDRRVRKVNPQGVITTVAGGGAFIVENTRDGLPATAAAIVPQYVTLDEQGNLLVSDRLTSTGLPIINRIRKISSVLPGFAGAFTIASEDGGQLYNFDGAGRHLLTLNALTGATLYTFAYDSAGRLTTITDGDNNITAIERNAGGQPTAIVAPFGQRTPLTLDSNGYLGSVTNPASEAHRMSYSSDGLLRTFTDPGDNVSTMNYDAQGRLIRDDNPAGGFFTLARTDSATGFTVSLTSALNRTVNYQVERLATGEERRVNTDASNLQTQQTIGTDDRRTVTDTDGTTASLRPGPDPRWSMQTPLTAQFTFTTPGGLTSTSTGVRAVTLNNPNDPLSLNTITDTASINGRAYTTMYMAASRTVTFRTPQTRQTTLTVDAQGRITQQQFANLSPASFTYEARGRLAGAILGTGAEARSSSFSYNSAGHLDTDTDPLGRTQSYVYDAAGRVTQQTLPGARVIGYGYDANGNLTSITPPGRPAHRFTYTPAGLVATYTPPGVGAGTGQTLYGYNLDRQLTTITRPDSQTLNFAYDSAGRLSAMTIPGGQYSYAYNAATGKLASITAPGGGALSYDYDSFLLTRIAWAGTISGSVSRAYDNNFRLTSQSVNGGNAINLVYDNDNLLTAIGNLALARDAQNGLVTGTTLGNVTDARGYNSFAEPTSYSAAFSGAPLYTAQYTRDKLGRVTQKTETVGGVTDTYGYTYDLAGRLTGAQKNGVTVATYTYGGNGNRLSYTGPGPTVTGSYDDQDRLTQYGATTYAYTANGELLSKTTGSQTTAYQYDALGNLRAVTLAGGAQIEYLIDGQNRRIGKRVGGALAQGFLYLDQLKPIAELDGSNNVVSRFVYGSRTNVPDYMIRGGVTYRIISDQVGSPRLVVNVATGAVAQRIDYDEFGVVLVDTNPGFQPFGFAGGIYDPQTKLVRFGARDYDAETGRWTVKDPIGLEGGLNLYAYVDNDPVNGIDPTGLIRNPIQCARGANAVRRLCQGLADAARAALRQRELREQARRAAAEKAEQLGKIGGEGMVEGVTRPLTRADQLNGIPRSHFSEGVRHFIEEAADTIRMNLPDIIDGIDGFLPGPFVPSCMINECA